MQPSTHTHTYIKTHTERYIEIHTHTDTFNALHFDREFMKLCRLPCFICNDLTARNIAWYFFEKYIINELRISVK